MRYRGSARGLSVRRSWRRNRSGTGAVLTLRAVAGRGFPQPWMGLDSWRSEDNVGGLGAGVSSRRVRVRRGEGNAFSRQNATANATWWYFSPICFMGYNFGYMRGGFYHLRAGPSGVQCKFSAAESYPKNGEHLPPHRSTLLGRLYPAGLQVL